MEKVDVRKAVGMALCHDITKIVPGEFKGRAFQKGHVIREEDVEDLLKLGKENIYVWDLQDGYVHENDGAQRLAKVAAGPGIHLTQPNEGKVELIADIDGFLKIDKAALYNINMKGNVAFATIHGNRQVKAGTKLAGTRIIPLVINEQVIKEIENETKNPVIEIIPFKKVKVGLIITGGEVYHGRIEDKFTPVLKEKMGDLGSEIIRRICVPDDTTITANAIREVIKDGAEMVILTGGMSVDPDDLTPASIRAAGGETVVYGVPVLPGAMFMLAYINDIPVMGLPGCVMYHRASIFDIVVQRILAGETVQREELVELAHGGLCLACKVCSYPDCSFGK